MRISPIMTHVTPASLNLRRLTDSCQVYITEETMREARACQSADGMARHVVQVLFSQAELRAAPGREVILYAIR